MADRWSNPSGSLGIDRFRVWPAGTDSYNHADNAANWDMVDALIGVPSAGNWPPSSGVDGGIYKESMLLKNERTPIGVVVPFFRPSNSIAIPTLWHVADGTVLTTGNHAFPGIAGSVTLPDLRNKFILGADASLSQGTAPAAVGNVNIDAAAGAPGENAVGGSNQITQTLNQMPGHAHTFAGNPLPTHSHTFSGNALGAHHHQTVNNPTAGNNDFVYWRDDLAGGGTNRAVADLGNYMNINPNKISALIGVETDAVSAGTPSGTNSSTSAGTPSGSISSAGSGQPMDNRPHYIGLIFIVKVLYSTTI